MVGLYLLGDMILFRLFMKCFASLPPQSTSMAHEEVNEETVYTCTGQPLPNDIAKIVEWMLNENFSTAYQSESTHTCRCNVA